jgi:hypothetical protein
MTSPKEIREAIEQDFNSLTSDDKETRDRARTSLLDYCTKEKTVNILQQSFYRTLEVLAGGAEWQSATKCLGRITCFRLTNKSEWDTESLTACHAKFANAKAALQLKMLDAVRLHLVVHPDNAALVAGVGWLKRAVDVDEKKTELHRYAAYLLDLFLDHPDLPGLVIKKPWIAKTVRERICDELEGTRVIGLRMASRVMLALEQGCSGASSEEATLWRQGLNTGKIVRSHLNSVKQGSTASAGSSARTLAELSKLQDFLKEMVRKQALEILVAKASPEECYYSSILAIFRRILTVEDFAAAFMAGDAPGRPNAKVCIAALEGADPEEARRILLVLRDWSEENPERSRLLDWSPLVRFLSAEDPDVLQPACDVVSHALRLQDMEQSAALIVRLKRDNALPALFSFLARPSTAYGILTIQCLVIPACEEDYVCDEEVVKALISADGLSRVLMALDEPHGDDFLPAALCVTCVAGFSKSIGSRLLSEGVLERLVSRFEAEHFGTKVKRQILAAMSTFVQKGGHQLVRENTAAASAACVVGLFLKVCALQACPQQAKHVLAFCNLQLPSPLNRT